MSALPAQLLALAPDPAAAKAAAALAVPRRWSALGGDGRAAWGECQGSAAQPYRAAFALDDGAAHCSCPSRKRPCKHALGLLLLLTTEPELFAAAEPPAWAAEWLAGRAARAGRQASEEPTPPHAEPDAAPERARRTAARADRRLEKAAAGLAELSAWLEDLVRAGVASAPSRPANFWDAAAARLVDAQLPGAARLVRQLGRTAGAGASWPECFVAAAARLHLLARAFGRLDALPGDLRADVRAALGLPVDADAAPDVVEDEWFVLGQVVEVEDRLRARRTWLAGRGTGRPALLLHFAHGDAPFAEAVPPAGAVLRAGLAFFPGTAHRAAVRAEAEAESDEAPAAASDGGPAPLPDGHARLADATRAWADALARNPWAERVPVVLAAAVPERHGARWLVRDAVGDAAPLAERFRDVWPLAAVAGGRPVWLAGEWDGDALLPLAAAGPDGAVVPLSLTPDPAR